VVDDVWVVAVDDVWVVVGQNEWGQVASLVVDVKYHNLMAEPLLVVVVGLVGVDSCMVEAVV